MKLFKGSALVYTLIMMMLLLVSALGLATTTLIQRNSGLATSDSIQAFQLANDGFEDIIASYKHNPVAEIGLLGSCDATTHEVTNNTTGTNAYKATFYKEGDINPLACGDSISDVDEVKIVATVGDSTRAIQTAFAASIPAGTVVERGSCAWRYDYHEGDVNNGLADNWGCTPGACPSGGWTDLGVSNEPTGVACPGTGCRFDSAYGSGNNHPVVVGRSFRVCVKS